MAAEGKGEGEGEGEGEIPRHRGASPLPVLRCLFALRPLSVLYNNSFEQLFSCGDSPLLIPERSFIS